MRPYDYDQMPRSCRFRRHSPARGYGNTPTRLPDVPIERRFGRPRLRVAISPYKTIREMLQGVSCYTSDARPDASPVGSEEGEMAAVSFSRQFRTASSEVYTLLQDGDPVGQLHLHFGSTEVVASLVMFQELPEAAVVTLIEQIDDDLVLPSDTPRDDFMVYVYTGKEAFFFSDDATRPSTNGES